MSKKSTNNNMLKTNTVPQEKIDSFEITKYLVDFLWHEPFYSRILRSLNKVETAEIPTAGVTTQDGDITLWWNRKFLAGLKPKQVMGLLKHECLHLVFGHTTERRKDPHIIWNYATDLAINSTIPENELPEGGLIPGQPLKMFEEHQAQMSNEEMENYYKLSALIESLPRNKTSEFYFERLISDPDVKEMLENQSQEYFGFDDHDGWDEMTDSEREVMAGKIREIVKDAANEANNNRKWGSISSAMQQQIMKMISNEIKWESLLKRFCGFTKRDERVSSIRKINRKYPGIFSGYKKVYKPMIAVYIDESGSVSNKELEKFYGELDNLSNRTDFYVYKFDHRVDESSSFLWKKRSRPNIDRTLTGGTCFDAVTKHAMKNKKRFDGYIVLTDGGAPKPRISQGLKRCWIISAGNELAFTADQNDIVIKIN
jgi:predicted metal-dependent peptidase